MKIYVYIIFPNYILENTKLYLLNRKIISNFAFK